LHGSTCEIVAPKPGKLGIVAIERLIAESQSEALFSLLDALRLD
jgi:hypothetical protein